MNNENNLLAMIFQLFNLVEKDNLEEKQPPSQNMSNANVPEDIKTGDEVGDMHEQNNTDSSKESTSSFASENDKTPNTKIDYSVDVQKYQKIVQSNYNCTIDLMKQIIESQQAINISMDQLRVSTIELGNSVRLSLVYDGIIKLITLWNLLNCSKEDICEYYSEILYEAFSSFGVVAIAPQSGDLYCPELHQKENSSNSSNTIISCEKYNWGWKLDDTVLKKAIVETADNEDI